MATSAVGYALGVTITRAAWLPVASAATGLAIVAATGGLERTPGGVRGRRSRPPAVAVLLGSLVAVAVLGWAGAPRRSARLVARTIAIPLVAAQVLFVVWTARAFVGDGLGNFLGQWLFLALTARTMPRPAPRPAPPGPLPPVSGG